MAVNQKLSEIGWFYHAPEPPKYSSGASADIPLASQIPGLNDLSSVPFDEVPRSMFRDTDTKYIRLAKMGGREDLLRFKDPKPKSKEPKAYPRNDWFYLEDNRMEAEHEEPNRPWEFRLPEYMVHDEHKPFGDDYDYKNDPEGLVYWKKGRVAPGNKEIKHVSRGGDGNFQPPPAPVSAPARVKSHRSAARQTESQQAEARYPNVPQMYDPEARPAMNKLLAYGYANEWQKTRDDWYGELRSMEDAARRQLEQQEQDRKPRSQPRNTLTWDDMMKHKNQPVNASKSQRVPSNTRDDKQMFKISKFEKVGPKVSTHRVLPPISGHH